jgi:hypothetical protein
MNYSELTLVELKNIARKNSIKGFSKLKKADLIKLIKKFKKINLKGGDECSKGGNHDCSNKKMVNGNLTYFCTKCGQQC